MARPAHRAAQILAVVSAALFAVAASAREKIDVVYLKNGDRVTGEILSMQFGELRVKTNSMSTVTIEWPDVASVESSQYFIIENLDGHRFYGTLSTDPTSSELSVVEPGGLQRFAFLDVKEIAPGEATFWNRLQGSFSLGFDYTKSSDIGSITGDADVTYRAPAFLWSLSLDLNSTRDPDQGTVNRDKLSYTYQWLRPNRQFWAGLSSLEHNEETGIDARLIVGGGYGMYFRRTAHSELSGLAGLVVTSEWATGNNARQESVEGILGVDWRIFRFSAPSITLTSSALLYPSITESGRYRTNLNVTLRREIITNFYLDLSFWQTYDSDPPDETALKTDYGVTTSLGYSFY